MASPTLEKTESPNGWFLGSLFVGSILLLSLLTKASLAHTIIVVTLGGLALWLYLRRLRPLANSPKPYVSPKEISRIRVEVLEEITEAMPRAIVVLNRNGVVVHANRAAESLLSADMVGRPVGAYLRTSSIRSDLELAFKGKIPPTLSVHILEPSERYLDVDFSQAIATQSNNAQSAVVFAVVADRTQAAKAGEQRADFLANASHELKTPIASMKGYIETLLGHAKDDPVAREKFLGIMGEQAERMERLVSDLLSLRRIESKEHIAPSETADLRKAIEAAQDALEVLAKTRGVNLMVSVPDAQQALTSGKTDECIQIFLNLMENAIKLSPRGSTVHTRLEQLPSWSGEAFPPPITKGASFRRIVNLVPSSTPVWRAVISDAGPGFSRDHLPRVGERFYRVAGDLPAQEKGTGLGLAIVKHIVMRHRAGLFVQSLHASDSSDTPSGTAFSIVFTATDPVH